MNGDVVIEQVFLQEEKYARKPYLQIASWSTKEYECTSGIRNSKKCILSSPNENNVKVGRCLMLEVYACHQ